MNKPPARTRASDASSTPQHGLVRLFVALGSRLAGAMVGLLAAMVLTGLVLAGVMGSSSGRDTSMTMGFLVPVLALVLFGVFSVPAILVGGLLGGRFGKRVSQPVPLALESRAEAPREAAMALRFGLFFGPAAYWMLGRPSFLRGWMIVVALLALSGFQGVMGLAGKHLPGPLAFGLACYLVVLPFNCLCCYLSMSGHAGAESPVAPSRLFLPVVSWPSPLVGLQNNTDPRLCRTVAAGVAAYFFLLLTLLGSRIPGSSVLLVLLLMLPGQVIWAWLSAIRTRIAWLEQRSDAQTLAAATHPVAPDELPADTEAS